MWERTCVGEFDDCLLEAHVRERLAAQRAARVRRELPGGERLVCGGDLEVEIGELVAAADAETSALHVSLLQALHAEPNGP